MDNSSCQNSAISSNFTTSLRDQTYGQRLSVFVGHRRPDLKPERRSSNQNIDTWSSMMPRSESDRRFLGNSRFFSAAACACAEPRCILGADDSSRHLRANLEVQIFWKSYHF